MTTNQQWGLKMKVALYLIMAAIYLFIFWFQFVGFAAQIKHLVGGGIFIAIICTIVILYIPFGAIAFSIISFFGLMNVEGWPWWQALAIAAPGVILFVIFTMADGMDYIVQSFRGRRT
ncbi:MAG: hypothetical protein HC900_00270 [Methylacidiphilales bacterium]|nr:hypothetical protein [Candidatus Methylacidiphilales bacterium]